MSVAKILPSKPSSATYATELVPASSLRLKVLASGWVLLLAGITIILHLELSVLLRILLAALWLGEAGLALGRLARAQARVVRLTMTADGRCKARDQSGIDQQLQLLKHSVLTRNLAWLRFRFADGRVYAELYLRQQVDAEAWRRLQLIWRWGQVDGATVK